MSIRGRIYTPSSVHPPFYVPVRDSFLRASSNWYLCGRYYSVRLSSDVNIKRILYLWPVVCETRCAQNYFQYEKQYVVLRSKTLSQTSTRRPDQIDHDLDNLVIYILACRYDVLSRICLVQIQPKEHVLRSCKYCDSHLETWGLDRTDQEWFWP